MSAITLHNADTYLETDNIIALSYVYTYKSTKWWRIDKPIVVYVECIATFITIPAGFYTDLSSVPKWLWSIFPPFGDFLLAAIIHDYLYVEKPKGITQKQADKEMLLWSNRLNKNKFDNYIRYATVRLFGRLVWDRKIILNKEK